MTAEARKRLALLLRQAEDDEWSVQVSFIDSDVRNLKIVSCTHIELDDTVMAVPVNTDGAEWEGPGVQFVLTDVKSVRDLLSRRVLFLDGAEPG